MTDEELPNFLEADIEDIWRYRQEHEEAERFHKERRKHAQDEILRRAAELEAQVFPFADGRDVTVTYPTGYQYNRFVVDAKFWPMVEEAGLQAEWNKEVQHSYKIRRPWLNRLFKRGKAWADVINKMTEASKGSPSFDGPPLSEMGSYAARDAEAEGVIV